MLGDYIIFFVLCKLFFTFFYFKYFFDEKYPLIQPINTNIIISIKRIIPGMYKLYKSPNTWLIFFIITTNIIRLNINDINEYIPH